MKYENHIVLIINEAINVPPEKIPLYDAFLTIPFVIQLKLMTELVPILAFK